jgi:hypothetical protein
MPLVFDRVAGLDACHRSGALSAPSPESADDRRCGRQRWVVGAGRQGFGNGCLSQLRVALQRWLGAGRSPDAHPGGGGEGLGQQLGVNGAWRDEHGRGRGRDRRRRTEAIRNRCGGIGLGRVVVAGDQAHCRQNTQPTGHGSAGEQCVGGGRHQRRSGRGDWHKGEGGIEARQPGRPGVGSGPRRGITGNWDWCRHHRHHC